MQGPAIACLLLSLSFAAFGQGADQPGLVEKPSPGVWPDRVYHWAYNPQGRPAWLSADEARVWVQEAARKWEVCGVRMDYTGETDRIPLRRDGANVVGWRTDLPPGTRGLTGGPSRGGRLIERDIAFSPDREEFRRYPRLLKKVLVHEFGHAIGLTHPAMCGDVMTLARDCERVPASQLPLVPTPHDLARCKALYP